MCHVSQFKSLEPASWPHGTHQRVAADFCLKVHAEDGLLARVLAGRAGSGQSIIINHPISPDLEEFSSRSVFEERATSGSQSDLPVRPVDSPIKGLSPGERAADPQSIRGDAGHGDCLKSTEEMRQTQAAQELFEEARELVWHGERPITWQSLRQTPAVHLEAREAPAGNCKTRRLAGFDTSAFLGFEARSCRRAAGPRS